MNYQDQTQGNERLSTNGYYTGHHKGSVTQDAAAGADNAPYYVERTSERFGTITQDALPDSMPKKALAVTYDLNGATGTLAVIKQVADGANKIAKLAAAPTVTAYPEGKQAPFTGWNTKAAGGGTSYTAEQADVTISADTVLYAQYTASE